MRHRNIAGACEGVSRTKKPRTNGARLSRTGVITRSEGTRKLLFYGVPGRPPPAELDAGGPELEAGGPELDDGADDDDVGCADDAPPALELGAKLLPPSEPRAVGVRVS